MKLTPTIADTIIERARTVLKRRVIIADDRGVVLAGGDRPGQIVVDALRACQEGRVVRAEFADQPVAWGPFVSENRTIGAFGVIEEGVQTTPEAISLLQGLAEVIAHQHFLLRHIQPPETMQANFLRQTLSTPNLDPGETYRQADILQMNLRLPQAIIVVEVTGMEPAAARSLTDVGNGQPKLVGKIRAAILEAFHNHAGNLCYYFGSNQFVLSKGIGGEGLTTRNTARFLREKADYIHELLTSAFPNVTISIGVGQYYPDLGGLRKSYQEAKLSLTVGTKVWGAGRVYHIKQVGMFVTLANVAQERKAELAHQILHPLLHDEQLYKTVQTFLQAGLNLTEAAERLHVHRNTLIYRLDKTKKVIGLDPRVFDDALQIKLGLMFYQEA
jgi:carbohydrate diacid regulator